MLKKLLWIESCKELQRIILESRSYFAICGYKLMTASTCQDVRECLDGGVDCVVSSFFVSDVRGDDYFARHKKTSIPQGISFFLECYPHMPYVLYVDQQYQELAIHFLNKISQSSVWFAVEGFSSDLRLYPGIPETVRTPDMFIMNHATHITKRLLLQSQKLEIEGIPYYGNDK